MLSFVLHPATYLPTKIVPSPMSTLEEGVRATVRLTRTARHSRQGSWWRGTGITAAVSQILGVNWWFGWGVGFASGMGFSG